MVKQVYKQGVEAEIFVVRNSAWFSTRGANILCEVIRCSGAGFANRGRIRASYALGVKTMKNGWGWMTKGTQKYRRILDKSSGLAAKWTACGVLRSHIVETGLKKLVRDVVRFVECDKDIGVLKANEALLKAEMELSDGLEGGLPHRGSEEAFTF